MITISTCGTSFFSRQQIDKKDLEFLNAISNKSESELSKDEKDKVDQIYDSIINNIDKVDLTYVKQKSAELNSLFSIFNDDFREISKYSHYFIYTDTYLGEKSFYIIKKYLETKNITVIPLRIPQLRVNDQENVLMGLSCLAMKIDQICDNYKDKKIFNLTGGFKVVQGYMQILSMFYADEIYYIFQGGQLIKIPKLSIRFDYDRNILDLIRKVVYEVPLDKKQYENLGILVTSINNSWMLSEWGEIVWLKERINLYKELNQPLSDKIRYSERFKRNFAKLSDKDKVELHENIDSFSRFVDTNDNKWNLRQVRFHELKGNPNNMTHEIYCFSGRDDRVNIRLDGNGIYNFEYIGPHL